MVSALNVTTVRLLQIFFRDKASEKAKKKARRNLLLTPGELTLDDLPPIEDLKITVPEDQVQVIGFIFNIVERQG